MVSNSKKQFQIRHKGRNFTLKEMLKGFFEEAHPLLVDISQFLQEWHNDSAYLLQKTSGSTGKPKEISLLKAHMKASAEATLRKLSINEQSTALLSLSPQFIGGKMMIVRALLGQYTLIAGSVSAKPLEDLETLNREAVEFFSFVPYQLQETIKDRPEDIHLLNQAKAIILGGAPVSNALKEQINQYISAPCYSTYGMTETVSHVALQLLNTKEASQYFEALPGISFSTDTENCLQIHAPEITGKETLTTNDIVDLLDETHFKWLGRKDFVVNSGGIKLHPEEIENELQALLQARGQHCQVMAFGEPSQKWGEQLSIIIENKQPIAELAHLITLLPKLHQPKKIYYLAEFSRTANDKLNRKATILQLKQ